MRSDVHLAEYSECMASFSERHGYTEARSVVQREGLDEETRIAVWNVVAALPGVFEELTWDPMRRDDTSGPGTVAALWAKDFKRPRDEQPPFGKFWKLVKAKILDEFWYNVLDLIEAVSTRLEQNTTATLDGLPNRFREACNDTFESYLVGYRFIGMELTPVDSTAEAESITSALDATDTIGGARHALDRAVELLADRQKPDYPNSIKESISAVEAVVKKVTGEGTLGAGLGKLEGAGLTIHPALKATWVKMYGWTSDDDGIRHGGIEAADADQALAKYVLVTSSAFVSYLTEEGRKVGLL